MSQTEGIISTAYASRGVGRSAAMRVILIWSRGSELYRWPLCNTVGPS